MKRITPGRLLALGVVLFAVALTLYVVPSNQYIFLPDKAHPVAPLVTVRGGHDPAKGGIYFVDVIVRKATILEKLFGGLHKGADLYPASAVNPPGVGDQQRRRIDLQDMQHSQQVAAAVALRAAGKHVVLRSTGALIDQVASGVPADGKLEPDDVIIDIDGKRVRDRGDLTAVMATRKIGQTVAMTVRRGKQTLVERMRTVTSGGKRPRAIVGIVVENALDIHLPFPVQHRCRRRRRPLRGPRLRARGAAAARTQRRSRPQDRRDRRDLPGRLRRPDRRHQAKDDRRARGGCGRLPRAGWGERAGCPQGRGWASDHPCGELSTGVARPGDTPLARRRNGHFSAGSNLPENARFPFRQALCGVDSRS